MSLYKYLDIKNTISIIFLSLAATSAHPDVTEWPDQSEIDTAAFEKRFIEIFSGSPSEPPSMGATIKCEIDEDKAREFSNLTDETQEAMMSSSSFTVDVDIDIDTLEMSSTVDGCSQLKAASPEKFKFSHFEMYRVPLTVKAPIKTHSEYEQELSFDMGGSTSETEYNHKSYSVRYWPAQPAHPDFPVEVITISSSTGVDKPTYSIMFAGNEKPDGSSTRVSMTSMNILGETMNNLAIIKSDASGRSVQNTYGTNTSMQMVNGKLNGLMTTDNYLYKAGQSQDPKMYTCYNMGNKINVFKITGILTCQSVSEDMIGSADVHVDPVYKIKLSSSNPELFNNDSPAKHQSRLEMRQPSAAKTATKAPDYARQKQLAAAFSALQSKAKCKLTNPDWAYTGDKCKNGMANGKGSAEDRQGLKFIGTFEAGQRVKGEIHNSGNMIFSGSLVDDKPDGEAICFHEGEYEECRFFKGKRIDTLYKIRKENAKMKAEMAQMRQAKPVSTSSQAKGVGDYAVDALQKEAADRAADFIFDKLF